MNPKNMDHRAGRPASSPMRAIRRTPSARKAHPITLKHIDQVIEGARAMHNRLITALVLGLVLIVPATTQAHEAAKGRHGGWRVDAGRYHAERVAEGTPNVIVYLGDADDKPIPAAGFKATAIIIIDGESQRFALAPAEGSKLIGTAPAPVKRRVKGVVQLTAPDGSTTQGKF